MTKRCRRGAFLSVAIALAALAAMASSASASLGLNAYEVDGSDPGAARTLAEAGFDVHEGGGGEAIEIIASRSQVAGLRKQGLDPELKVVDGMTARQFAVQDVNEDGSYDVYRPYFNDECTPETCYVGQEGGEPRQTLYQEMLQLAADNPAIVKPVEIGRTINDVPILALRVTRDAREASNPDGSKPAALYSAAQHAREWITPEMVRRLAHLYIDNYGGTGTALGTDGEPVDGVESEKLTRLVNQRELWFVFGRQPRRLRLHLHGDERLWRKNLRDNNGDGADHRRRRRRSQPQLPDLLELRQRGVRLRPGRRHLPRHGPRLRAGDPGDGRPAAAGRLRVHGQLPLGRRAAALRPTASRSRPTSPDDTLYQALSGTDLDPAIPGGGEGAPNPYDPDLSSELYTTNGETTEHAHSRYGTLAWTPEMDVSDPERGGGTSVFEFQDSEAGPAGGVREERAVRARRGRCRPTTRPTRESHLGQRSSGPFQIRPFDVVLRRSADGAGRRQAQARPGRARSTGSTAAATKLAGDTRVARAASRYGREAATSTTTGLRGQVTGTKPRRLRRECGSRPTRRGKRSQPFTYTVAYRQRRARVLPAGGRGLHHSKFSRCRRQRPGGRPEVHGRLRGERSQSERVPYDVYDVDGRRDRTAPDALGVLSHYRTGWIWETGDDPGDPRDRRREPGSGASRALTNDLILSVRDYLNEGGKLLYTGQNIGPVERFVPLQPGGPASVLPAPAGGRIENMRGSGCPTTSSSTHSGAFAPVDAANDKDAGGGGH